TSPVRGSIDSKVSISAAASVALSTLPLAVWVMAGLPIFTLVVVIAQPTRSCGSLARFTDPHRRAAAPGPPPPRPGRPGALGPRRCGVAQDHLRCRAVEWKDIRA